MVEILGVAGFFDFGFDMMNRNIDSVIILIIAEKMKLP
jgi:hypothetical protein